MDLHKFHSVVFFSASVGKKYAKVCAAQTYHSVNVGDREMFRYDWRHSRAMLQAYVKIHPKRTHSMFIMRMSVPIPPIIAALVG